MRRALSDMIVCSKATTKLGTMEGKPFKEECGFFIFNARDWAPGTGWAGDIQYVSVENKSKHEGGFIMDNQEVAMVLTNALLQREFVAASVCGRYGWDESTPWTVAFYEHANAEVEKNHPDIDISAAQRSDMISEYFRQEQLDLAQGWDRKKLAYLAMESKERVDGGRLSAFEWLMVRGIGVLAGLGHSHPSGNADLSPDDYLAQAAVDSWAKMYQARFVEKGQAKDSVLELNRSVGNWIYGLPDSVELHGYQEVAKGNSTGIEVKETVVKRFSGSSTLARYDRRGKRGEWTGAF
jgi:hypothetical protein